MLDAKSTDELVQAFQTRMAASVAMEQCACQAFPEVSGNDCARELVEMLLGEIYAAFMSGDIQTAYSMLGHGLTTGVAFGMVYGATDAITDDSGDYSWGLTESDLAELAAMDFLGDDPEGEAPRE